MRVHDEIKKCVGFITMQMADETFRLAGTFFFVWHETAARPMYYAVTAKHVIEGIRSKGLEKVYLRANAVDGRYGDFETDIDDWICHAEENVDIAILPSGPGMTELADQVVIGEALFADHEYINTNEVGAGDEVFIIGLFHQHHGRVKNLPIVRMGSIASMPDEEIHTGGVSREAYLIEARSIGGLSGSPVFVTLVGNRPISKTTIPNDQRVALLGLIYGHFDLPGHRIDEVVEDVEGRASVNVGIAIVTPITKLTEMFNDPRIERDERKRWPNS